MTYLSFYRLVKSMKRQIIYRLTEILSFYAFLRPDESSLWTASLKMAAERYLSRRIPDLRVGNNIDEIDKKLIPASISLLYCRLNECGGISCFVMHHKFAHIWAKIHHQMNLTCFIYMTALSIWPSQLKLLENFDFVHVFWFFVFTLLQMAAKSM